MGINIYMLPMFVAVSLVYAASRYEDADRIWRKSVRTFITMVVFFAVVWAILAFFSLWQ